jgi:hypothetical protein
MRAVAAAAAVAALVACCQWVCVPWVPVNLLPKHVAFGIVSAGGAASGQPGSGCVNDSMVVIEARGGQSQVGASMCMQTVAANGGSTHRLLHPLLLAALCELGPPRHRCSCTSCVRVVSWRFPLCR